MGKCAIPNLDSHWILYEIASYLVEIGLKYQFQSKKFWIITDKISFQKKGSLKVSNATHNVDI